MQSKQSYESSFSAGDIERYYNGGMSAQERHALEKAALDDPFLADALEGYALTPTPAADVAALQVALQERTGKKNSTVPVRSLYFKWMGAAAILLLMAGAGWVVYQLADLNHNEVALQKVQDKLPEAAVPVPATPDTVMSGNTADAFSNNKILPLTTNTIPEQKAVKANTKVTQKAPAATMPVQQDQPVIRAAKERDAIVFKKDLDTSGFSSAPSVASVDFQARAQRQMPVSKIIRGRITNLQKEPVPFALINNEKNNISTLADANGQFELSLPDTATQVQVSAIGYGTKKVDVKELQDNIVLQPHTQALNEVVITATANKRAIIKPDRIIVEEAEPASGWRQFNDYVAANLKSPETLEIAPIKGAVRLSFDVDEKGNAVNIKVEKSLCPRCDEEAIRILKDSPKWKKKKAKRAKASVRF